MFLYQTKSNIFKSFVIFFIIIAFLLILTTPVLAGDNDYGLKDTAKAAGLPTKHDVPSYLGIFIGGALALSGSIFLVLIVYGGIVLMTSGGNEKKVASARKIITYAIIGVLILGTSYAILNFVFGVFTQ